MATPRLGSVANALRVLCALAEYGEMGVSSLSRKAGFPKTMVHRILTTLKHEAFVLQDPVSKKYKVGPMACTVGQAFLVHNNIYSATISCLEDDLRAYTSYVGYMDGYETITIAVREGSGPVTVRPTGSRAYVHTTAVGKVMAAYLPEAEIERRFLGWTFPKVTRYTIDSYEGWVRDLRAVRQRGYSITMQELDIGVASIGAPLWGPSGILAGLSIVYAVGTIGPEEQQRLIQLVVDSAARVSDRLGGLHNRVAAKDGKGHDTHCQACSEPGR
ncbi:MAG: IclR family transcriptional regulator [Ignavibacteriales bacterium]